MGGLAALAPVAAVASISHRAEMSIIHSHSPLHSSLGAAALLCACTPIAQATPALPWQGARFVAMGSSFAAGPGIAAPVDSTANRCGRSSNNYALLPAREFGLQLTDVSCSGATTSDVLRPRGKLPAQIDALTTETRLVTITIGGNDVGYIGTLGSASCRTLPIPPSGTPGGKCPAAPSALVNWSALKTAMSKIALEVHRRAPSATLIFVDYLTVLSERGACDGTPLPAGQADASRATAKKLAKLTKTVAAETGSELFTASAMSRTHSACDAEPWVTGFPLPGALGFIPYHPNQAGMSAIASSLARRLRTKARP